MNNIYNVNTKVQLQGSFTDGLTGAPADPTSVTVFVQSPNNVITPYVAPNVVRQSVGYYTLDLVVDLPGRWWYKFEGDGAAQASSPDTEFTVNSSRLV